MESSREASEEVGGGEKAKRGTCNGSGCGFVCFVCLVGGGGRDGARKLEGGKGGEGRSGVCGSCCGG